MDNDGQPELVCGWSHGRFDARRAETGEVIFKEKLEPDTTGQQQVNNAIAALVVGDWLQLGHVQLIVCSRTGQGNISNIELYSSFII